MTALEALTHTEDFTENQKAVREMVLDGLRDIDAGRTRNCDEFFKDLENRYLNA